MTYYAERWPLNVPLKYDSFGKTCATPTTSSSWNPEIYCKYLFKIRNLRQRYYPVAHILPFVSFDLLSYDHGLKVCVWWARGSPTPPTMENVFSISTDCADCASSCGVHVAVPPPPSTIRHIFSLNTDCASSCGVYVAVPPPLPVHTSSPWTRYDPRDSNRSSGRW
jgi:hypothetical protein